MDINDFVKQLNSIVNQEGSNVATVAAAPSSAPSSEPGTVVAGGGKKIKMLIVSTHINQANGYSKIIYSIINQLAQQKWLDIVHFGTQKIQGGEVGRRYPSNVRTIDGTALEKEKRLGFAFSEVAGVINSEKPDIVFIYNDIAVISSYIEEIRKSIQNRFFKIWAYIDMVYQVQPQAMIDIVNRDVERIFCFSKGWKEQLKMQGITRPVDVIGHAVDTKIIRPIPRDLARQSLGLPKDIFMFSSLNKNIPRKRLDILVMAFVKLIVRFPMKPIFMLIVADKGDRGGYALFDIFARELKLAGASVDAYGNRLLITSSNTAYKDDDINLLYNCGDVGVSCADGEGWGLCTFEQMALGIPQIVPDILGHREYCTPENCQMIKPRARYYIPLAHSTTLGEGHLVDPDDVAKAMENYVFDEDMRKLHGKLGKEKVAEYSWEKNMATLIKRLKALQEEDD
jgi:glycosyltransferase involved in cell wall biosynthesis